MDMPLRRAVQRWSVVNITLICLLVLSTSAALAQYTYTTVDVPFPGATDTYLMARSDGGTMTGTYRDAAGRIRSFVGKQAEKKVAYQGKPLEADDVNAHVRVVGSYQLASGQRLGFAMQGGRFSTLKVSNWNMVGPCSVNDANNTVCMVHSPESSFIALFSGSTLMQTFSATGITTPTAEHTYVYGISNGNDIVGAMTDYASPVLRGWAREGWSGPTAGTEHIIDAPCGGDTILRDVNQDRLMAATCETGTDPKQVFSYAFDVRSGLWTELLVPGALSTHVNRVNNHGHFVGWYEGADHRAHGFVAIPVTAVAQR